HFAQSRNGFLKSPMSHFVRREDFGKKFAGRRSDMIEPATAVPFANRKKQCLLVNKDKFDQAHPAGHCLSAHFVSLAKSGFILTKQIGLERGRIVFRKSGRAFFPLYGGCLHWDPLNSRATRTNASSLPL